MNLVENRLENDYAKIFDQRGALYNEAMTRDKSARDLEFAQLFAKSPCVTYERIIDAPSGGAYLQDFLLRARPSTSFDFLDFEFASGFGDALALVDPCGEWPVEERWADRAICLAASHHIENLGGLLENFRRASRSGAIFHLADVEPGSGIACFLDTFVDKHTGTGHRGLYRDFRNFHWPDWLNVKCIEKRPCPWIFESEIHMLQFCMLLFGLGDSARPLIRESLSQLVGICVFNDRVELNWELVYVDAVMS